MAQRIAIVGAGLAGCAAAARLAHAGFDVTLYEKNDHLGGKMNILQEAGYTFDMGPTIITKPDVIFRLFQDVGKDPADYLTLVDLDPQWRAFFTDGSQKMTRELNDFAPGELGAYL
jgi:diapolycopene oxygenase